MDVVFSPSAWEDLRYWQNNDGQIADKLMGLVKACRRYLLKGTGKPEPLSGNLSGWWSRRISHEHRLMYRVAELGEEQVLQVAQCRYRKSSIIVSCYIRIAGDDDAGGQAK